MLLDGHRRNVTALALAAPLVIYYVSAVAPLTPLGDPDRDARIVAHVAWPTYTSSGEGHDAAWFAHVRALDAARIAPRPPLVSSSSWRSS